MRRDTLQNEYRSLQSREDEGQLLQNFTSHFRNPNRSIKPETHHDFLESLKLQKERGDFSQQPYSSYMRSLDVADKVFVSDRIERSF